jgi:RNA polymerase sigma-70 factor (ECF subfamily)
VNQESFRQRLSAISTQWTTLLKAHGGSTETVSEAQRRLMERYHGAVFRYFLGAVRDPDAAAELTQEFALRFVRGDFRRADRERGRFRDYLKTALVHMATDHFRNKLAAPRQLGTDPLGQFAPAEQSLDGDAEFLKSWREEFLDRTWRALAEVNSMYHAVLLHRVENPDTPSAQVAAELSAQLQRPLNAAVVRKAVQRGHEKFSDLLLREIGESLGTEEPAALREELIALDLLKYCRSALERREKKP